MCNDEQYVSTSLGMTLQMCFYMHFMSSVNGMFVSFVDITEIFLDIDSVLAPCWPQGL